MGFLVGLPECQSGGPQQMSGNHLSATAVLQAGLSLIHLDLKHKLLGVLREMWVRIDDGVPQHPKFLKAGMQASWFWLAGNCYCQKYLTDGFIIEHALISLSPGAPCQELAEVLVAARLWEKVEGGYQVHDFHDHNPRAAHVKAKREQDRNRKRNSGGIYTDSERIPDGLHTESERIPDGLHTDSERIPDDASRAPAIPNPKSLIPNPKSQSVNTHGENGFDVKWEQFKAAYPAKRRSSGFMANQHFLAACEKVGFPKLMAALELHKRSEDWKKGMIPGLEKWLEQELWIQEPENSSDKSTEIGRAHLRELERRRAEKR